jgi:uncharacterized protein
MFVSWSPKHTDYEEALQRQNPWHTLSYVPNEYAKPIRRPLAEKLWATVLGGEPHRYQLILGPRRVGKTTVMYQTVQALLDAGVDRQRLWWLRLDHPLLIEIALGKLVEPLVRQAAPDDPLYLFLDELTYAADWDLWLKTFYDEKWPLRIVATSSSTAALRQGQVESGVGRWQEQYLSPWLFSEYLSLRGAGVAIDVQPTLAETLKTTLRRDPLPGDLAKERARYLTVGGFPELLVLDPTGDDEASEILRSQRVLRSDAVERALYRDLPQAVGISEPLKLERLLYALAGQLAGLVSATKIGQALELSQPTVDRYISYLERAFLVFLLPNFSESERQIQRRGRKLYFVDGAVRNAALQRGIGPLRDPAEMGYLFENAVAAHLHALGLQAGSRLCHWRRSRHEVDLVYLDAEAPLAFEIASSGSHSTQGLEEFQRSFGRFAGRCYLVSPDAPRVPAEAGSIGRVPLDLLLVAIGAQAEATLRARLAA